MAPPYKTWPIPKIDPIPNPHILDLVDTVTAASSRQPDIHTASIRSYKNTSTAVAAPGRQDIQVISAR